MTEPFVPSAVGSSTETLLHQYTWRDVALYALGIGATPERELGYLYEALGPKVFPTYSVVAVYPVLQALLKKLGGDLKGLVHGAQAMSFHREIAPEGKLFSRGTIEHVYDLKRMAIAILKTETHNALGELVTTSETQLIFRHDGGFGGRAPPHSRREKIPNHEPDFVYRQLIPDSQAALYRLLGDLNPLHIDPVLSRSVGFNKPLLHGLCTFGYAARAVALHIGDAARLESFSADFRGALYPAETLIIQGWQSDQRITLQAHSAERPSQACLSNAVAVLRSA